MIMTSCHCRGVAELWRRSQRIAHQHFWNTFISSSEYAIDSCVSRFTWMVGLKMQLFHRLASRIFA